MQPRDLFLSPDLAPEKARSFLYRLGFRDPERADRHLQELVETVGLPERIAAVADLLLSEIVRTADPDAALRNFGAFLERVPSPLNFLSFLEANPQSLEILLVILGASPYLTQTLLRNPEYFYWLVERNRLQRVSGRKQYQEAAREMTRPTSDLNQALNALRRFRRRESLRIGTQDLMRTTSLAEAVSQLSALAEAVLSEVFSLLSRQMLADPAGFAVLALGKLGGGELNFSSDIDLLYLYQDDARRDEMLRFAREYTRVLSEFTPEGHFYRVDLRLRPMGKSGEIVYSESAARNYYQTWADTTDRLAMIKCRPVAGDLDLGRRFVESLQDFIYKKYLDHAALEEIRWIKKRTDQALSRRHESERNVKLGLGGIREIEFFVQSFQILYGGLHPELRGPNTLWTLDRLCDLGFIELSEYDALRQAYIFLREVEHKLQLVHDLQTHSLPQEDQELCRCARRMGYVGENGSEAAILEQFSNDLQMHCQKVRTIFESLFENHHESGSGLRELALNASMEAEEAVKRLAAANVARPEELWEGLQLLLRASSFPHSPTRMRNLLANLVPSLIEAAASLPDPRSLFTRLDRFCESLGTRVQLYTEIVENPDFRHDLLHLLASGPFLSDILIRYPELVDAVAYRVAPTPGLKNLSRFVEQEETTGRPARDALRIFKRREEFKIALRKLLNPRSFQSGPLMTQLAEACIHQAIAESLKEHPEAGRAKFAIVALGKLAGYELTFHSDLDLVFIYDDRKGTQRQHRLLLNLLDSFRRELQEYTPEGRVYDVDFRLRPEGKHGAQIVSLSSLKRYFRERAEPWERLAYVRARPIFRQSIRLPLKSLIFSQPFNQEEISELARIRQRKELEIGRERQLEKYDLKVGPGGLMDIQFILQRLQIEHDVVEYKPSRTITKLESRNAIDHSSATLLKKAVDFLLSVEAIQDLVNPQAGDKISWKAEENASLAHFLGYHNPRELLSEYQELREKIRELYFRFYPHPKKGHSAKK